MPRHTRATRQRILESAYRLFYREGFQRSGVDAVAEATGVTQRTLYNHFPSKDALIAAVLEAQADLAETEIRSWCDKNQVTPETLVSGLFEEFRRWARMPDWRSSGFTRATMELAWAPGHPGRRAAAEHKRAIERILAEALTDAGARQSARIAREIVLLIEGVNVLCLVHEDAAYIEAAEAAALALLASK
jgi:AcrR family transcriptional regulator